MKKTTLTLVLTSSVLALAACTTDSTYDDFLNSQNYTGGTSGTTGSNSGSANLGTGDLSSFTVAIDKSTAEPATNATAFYPEAEDNLDDSSNSSDFSTEVTIDVSNPTTGTVNGVEITNNGGTIVCNHGSNKVSYVLTGTTSSGSVTIMGDKKCEVKLNGVHITSPDSAALNVLCKKRCFLYVVDGTSNTLSDTDCSSDAAKVKFIKSL